MKKQSENMNKELLDLKQTFKELNIQVFKQEENIRTLCLEVEDREKELRFHHKAGKILNNPSFSAEKVFQKLADILPKAFQLPEKTHVSLEINGWVFNSKAFKNTKIFIETFIQLESNLIGFIKVYYQNDDPLKRSKFFIKREKELLRILSMRLSDYYGKYLNDLTIKKNEDNYQRFIDSINDVIYEIAADGNLLYINNSIYNVLGYHPKELIGRNFLEKLYPDDLPLLIDALNEIGKDDYSFLEYRFVTKDGKIKWVRSSTKAILENGIVIGGRGTLIDIHEEKIAQILLVQNEKKLQFKTRLQELLVDISNKYINLPLNQLDFKINKSLGDLGKFVGADRFYIFDYDFEKKSCSNTFEWCSEGIEPQIDELQNVPIDYIPEWVNAHINGETLYVENVLALNTADNLRKILEPQGIKSLVTVPIMDGENCIGFTGFDAVKDYHIYSSDEVELLKVFAQILMNIKNRLKSQQELEESNQKLNVLLNNLSGVIYHSTFDGKNWNLSFINDTVFELTGYKASDFLNNTKIEFNDLIDKEDLPRVLEEVLNATNNKLPYNIEYRIFNAAGQQKWVWENGHGVFDGNKLIGQEGFITDISEKKQIEEELLKREEELNQAQEIAKMGSWYMNLLTNKIILSHNYYKLVERKEKDTKLKEDLFYSIIHKDDVHLINNKLEEIKTNKSQRTQELRLIMPDGRIKWVQSTILPVYHNDVLIAYKGVKFDITEKKLQEEEIRLKNIKLSAILGAIPDMIFTSDSDGNYLEFFKSFKNKKIIDYRYLIGKNIKDEFKKHSAALHLEKIKECLQTKKMISYEYPRIEDGKTRYYDGRIVFMEDNKVLRSVRDITNRKKQENEIIDLNTNLELKIDERTAALHQMNNNLQQEIQQRKQIEEALSKSEFNYRSVIENVNEVIFKTDENGLWLFLNKSWEEITGFSTEESIGQSIVNYVHPEDRQQIMEFFAPMINREIGDCRQQVRYLTKDGGFCWIEVFARLDVNEYDEIAGIYGTLNDITERKKAEDALEIEKQRLASIIEGTNVGTWEWNIKTGETIFNERWATILGYSLEEISPTSIESWLKFSHPEDLHKSNELLQMHFQGKLAYYTFESRMKHRNGSWIWVLDRGKVNTWDHDGKPLFMSGTHQDITEQKEAEQELNWNKTLLELMSNSSPFGFLVVDNRTDNILYFNKRFCQIWEIEQLKEQMERGELKNNDIIPYCIPVLADVPAFAESCKPLQDENNRIVLDDEIAFTNSRTIRRFTTQIRGNNDEYFGRFYIFEDITEDKRKSKEIIKAKNEAMRANKAKSTFLANMSHEIRTPMNAVLGYADILNAVITDKTHKEFINAIQTSGKSLLTIINDVLDLSKIEAGKLELEFDYIKTVSFFAEFQDVFAHKLQEKGVNFILEIADGTPSGLYVDESRLRQVILNLIGNAVKFTHKGFVKVSVRCQNSEIVKYTENKSEEFTDLVIVIEDTGIGISSELQEKVFEEFIQAEGRNIQGTGLGLAISKRLVNLMNGEIMLQSQINSGSIFKVIIPEVAFVNDFENEQTESTIDSKYVVFDKSAILVVDDIEINRQYIKDAFKDSQIKIFEASNGLEGLKIATEVLPNLIISDIRMPEMDGFEFMDLIKKNEKTRHIPVIAYSASVMKEQKIKIYQSEFVGLLIKPVLLAELIQELCKFLPYKYNEPTALLPIHKNTENLEEIQDLETLIHTLNTDFMETWEGFKKRQPIGEIKEFGNKLATLGKLHNAQIIINFADDLLRSAENFNIDNLLSLIKKFPIILNKLKK